MEAVQDVPLSKEEVISEIKRISAILSGEKNEEYYLTCERFIGEKNFIRKHKGMVDLERLSHYYGLLESESSRSMQYSQINYCVICSLDYDQFTDLEEGIKEARARRDGFADYKERSEIAQNLGLRMAAILALSDDDNYRKQQIAYRLSERHSALFSNLWYLDIDPNLPLEKLLPLALLEIDKKQMDMIMRTSIEQAEKDLVELEG